MNKLKKIKKYKIEKKLFYYGGLFFNSYDEYNNKKVEFIGKKMR